MKIRIILLAIAALFVAFNAAFFSVSGLSKLFAGASLSVILMASSLELAKLIGAAFLHNYWDRLSKLIRIYLTMAIFVLIIITSAGIYGFLTSAYQTTADQLSVIEKQTELVQLKKERYETQLNTYNTEKQLLSNNINELTIGLSNNTIQYVDKETGQLITTTSSNTRRVLTDQINDAKLQISNINDKIDIISDSITNFDIQILNIQQNSDLAAEVGPLRYISEITNKPMKTIVNWFALLIIFVFDPLAVSLVIAFNSALKIEKNEREKKRIEKSREIYGDKKDNSDKLIELNTDTVKKEKIDNESVKHTNKFEKAKNESISDFKEIQKPKVDNTLSKLKISYDKIPVDIDNDGIIDGYDTNGDGLIDIHVPASSKRAEYAKNQLPYYARSGFNWGNVSDWVNNQAAVNYWITFIKNKVK